MSEEKPRQDFPSFWEGLSLREHGAEGHPNLLGYFPTFLQGLSLRRAGRRDRRGQGNPVSLPFLEGLSLRQRLQHWQLAG